VARSDGEIRVVNAEVVLIPRPPTARVGGGFKQRTQFATIVLSIRAESGLVGESYISLESIRQAQGLALILTDAIQSLVGIDAFARQSVTEILGKELRGLLPGSGAAQMLFALVDIALWDLNGKLTGLPVWRLNGGAGASVDCYASNGLFAGETEEQLDASARRILSKGFRAVKLRIGGRPLAEDVARARRVRAIVGPDTSIMVDALWSLTSTEAIRFGRAVEDLDIAWLEDPTAEGDLRELKRVRDNIAIPVASAERASSVAAFQAYLDAEAIDIAILDIYHIGGATAWLQCAALANERAVRVAGHAAPAYSSHLVSASENGYVAEYFPFWDELHGGALTPEKGAIRMTDEPGWGISLDRAALERYRQLLADQTKA
jgi:L-alanine-DL-glutamate epimerase-like enolase superfamily enzyme